jgi:Protein of unknown function (DUF3014)
MIRVSQIALGLVIAVALMAVVALIWWQLRAPAPATDLPVATSAESSTAAAPAASSAVTAATTEVPTPEPQAAAVPIAPQGIRQALTELLGDKAVTSMLQLDDFPRRFAATVDNLGRSQAPSMLWPIQPMGGRFTVIEREGGTVVSPDNALRYAPFVLLVEHIDSAAAADVYIRLLPLVQQAYEDLGFPRSRFHARLLAVIDELLATPEVPEQIRVNLTQVQGPIPSVRPWVRYEFADASLQSSSAGQKIMLRVGAVNQRRLKAKLSELRSELVRRTNK